MVWYGIFSHMRVIIIKLSITCFTISYEDENQYTYSQFHIECIHHNTQNIWCLHTKRESHSIYLIDLSFAQLTQFSFFFSQIFVNFIFFCASIRLILFVLSTNNPCAGENSHDSEMFHSHLDESCITVLHSLLVIVYKSDTVNNQCICVCVCVCVCVIQGGVVRGWVCT